MSSLVVEAENLRKTFSWTPVLNGVSCCIQAGEAVAVFGPNGAGKTTFLRLLATLLKPSAGSLRLFGYARHDPAVRRRLGFLGHESLLYPDLTAVENLTFYGRAYNLPELETRIDAALERVEPQDWRHTVMRTFSRGMEQRLALARALLHEPDLLLLDEPYTGLDTRAVTMLQTTLAHAKEHEKTIVLTAHDFERGLELCDRVIILNRGRIVWQSTEHLPSLQELGEIYHTQTRPPGLWTLDSRL